MCPLPPLPDKRAAENARKVPFQMLVGMDWPALMILALTATGLIILGHGCHPGGHDNDIDDELVYRNHAGP
jgi:hypothetical protein